MKNVLAILMCTCWASVGLAQFNTSGSYCATTGLCPTLYMDHNGNQ